MSEKARKVVLAKKSEIADFDNLVLSQIHQVHAKLESAYAVHKIIKHESMPQIEHIV